MTEFTGLGVDDDIRAAIELGLRAMGGQPNEVHVAENFTTAVRQDKDDETYDSERGTGVVAARTSIAEGKSRVLLNWTVIESLPLGDIERLAAHESGHVLLHSRSEVFGGYAGLFDSSSSWHLGALQAAAIEEFRIELALARLGYGPSDMTDPDSLLHSVHHCNGRVLEAVMDPRSEDIEFFRDSVMSAINDLVTVFAYAAARTHHQKSDPRDLFPMDLRREAWEDLIGTLWDRAMSLYSLVPAATEPLDLSIWEDLIRASAVLSSEFLDRFGFSLLTIQGEQFFTRTASDETITNRIRRFATIEGLNIDS